MGWVFAWVASSEGKAWLFVGFLRVLKGGGVELYLVVLGVVMGGGAMLRVWRGDGIGLGFCWGSVESLQFWREWGVKEGLWEDIFC